MPKRLPDLQAVFSHYNFSSIIPSSNADGSNPVPRSGSSKSQFSLDHTASVSGLYGAPVPPTNPHLPPVPSTILPSPVPHNPYTSDMAAHIHAEFNLPAPPQLPPPNLYQSKNLRCICGQGEDWRWMIACAGGCQGRFHGACVGINERIARAIEKYVCPNCEARGAGTTIWARSTAANTLASIPHPTAGAAASITAHLTTVTIAPAPAAARRERPPPAKRMCSGPGPAVPCRKTKVWRGARRAKTRSGSIEGKLVELDMEKAELTVRGWGEWDEGYDGGDEGTRPERPILIE
ncbi:hypothetical protein MMC30_007847 [Trapelia coarctata]|nr:hypothetical protein [Trapelia coarctata]